MPEPVTLALTALGAASLLLFCLLYKPSKNDKMLAIRKRIADICIESSQSTTITQMEVVVEKAKAIYDEAQEFKKTAQQHEYLLAAIQMRLCLIQSNAIQEKYSRKT
jgi:hypothetical protein